MSPLAARLISRPAARYFASAPPATIATPLPQRLQAQKAKMWAPKKSGPVEGFGLIGLLAGTMFVCIIPGLWAAVTPKAGGDDH